MSVFPKTAPPLIVPGLITWLDAADPLGDKTLPANGAAISSWKDKSGQGNTVTQGTGAAQPTFVTSALAGLPTVRFNGSKWLSKTSGFPDIVNLTVFFVASMNAGTTAQAVYEISNGAAMNTGNLFLYDSSLSLRSRYIEGTSTTKTVSSAQSLPTGYFLNMSYYDGSNLYFLKDGVSVGSIASTANTNTLSRLDVGQLQNSSYRLIGDICELIIYNNSISSENRAIVQQYLANKWAMVG